VRASLRIGRFAGIPVGLHWSIAAIAAVLVISLSGTVLPSFFPGYGSPAYLVTAVVVAALFLASLIAHELGHSVVAIRNGVGVRGITLFALGGVAKLDGDADDPGAAARIAAAGPAVSVGIGLASLALAAGLSAIGAPTLMAGGVAWLGVINLTLAVFNLLPALPLDGGRILQALLWKRSGDRHLATISAATVGRYGGWALVLYGLWTTLNGGFGLWTMLIGGFVILTARAEELRARAARRQSRGGGGWNPWTLFDPPTPGPMGPTAGPSRPAGAPVGSPRGPSGVPPRDDGIDVGPGREATPGPAGDGSARQPGHQEQPGERQHRDPAGARRVGLGVTPSAGVAEAPPVGFVQGVQHRSEQRAGHPGPYRIVTGQVLIVGGAPQIDLRRLDPAQVVGRRR
jgi:Zn-dependent protease